MKHQRFSVRKAAERSFLQSLPLVLEPSADVAPLSRQKDSRRPGIVLVLSPRDHVVLKQSAEDLVYRRGRKVEFRGQIDLALAVFFPQFEQYESLPAVEARTNGRPLEQIAVGERQLCQQVSDRVLEIHKRRLKYKRLRCLIRNTKPVNKQTLARLYALISQLISYH